MATQVENPLSAARLVEVVPGRKRNFYDAPADATEEAMLKRAKAYVVAGDLLVATATLGRFTRVAYVNHHHRARSGWIESAALRQTFSPMPAPHTWRGEWIAGEIDADIEISSGKMSDSLRLDANATWGTNDPVRVRNGAVHDGGFAVEALPDKDLIAFTVDWTRDQQGVQSLAALPYSAGDVDDCRVAMRLLGPYLLVRDNDNCGGVNVTFSGLYRRR